MTVGLSPFLSERQFPCMQLGHTRDNRRNDVLVVNPDALDLVMRRVSKKPGKRRDEWNEETEADS